jgi:hypothetical protein
MDGPQDMEALLHDVPHHNRSDELTSNEENNCYTELINIDDQCHAADDATGGLQQTATESVYLVERTQSNLDATEASTSSILRDDSSLDTSRDGIVDVGQNALSWEHPIFQDNMSWEEILSSLRMESYATDCLLPLKSSVPRTPPQNSSSIENVTGTDDATCTAARPPADAIRRAVTSLNDIIQGIQSPLDSHQDPLSGSSRGRSLNVYLELFLARFPGILPVVHKATFDATETAPSALLLMLALGTNCSGSPAAVLQGEHLWTLAHAVATISWSSILTNRGPHDICEGVQLVLTAVLGQTYALMSANGKLRTTAQVVHDLGFHWARQCGMYDADYGHYPTAEDSSVSQWKAWAAKETQLRVVLAHYVLDGHIAQISGESVCVRHSVNPLPMPSSNAAFIAPDPNTWKAEMSKTEPVKATFRQYILALFRGDNCDFSSKSLSEYSVRVVLECFQSFASERHEGGGDAVGLPSLQSTIEAMIRLYQSQIQESSEETQLSIRWHSILGFSLCTDVRHVCYQLCKSTGTMQTIFPPSKSSHSTSDQDIRRWVNSQEGWMTLLHSFAVCRRLSDLPLQQASGIQVPLAAFLAAIPLLAFLSTNTTTLVIPIETDWRVSADLCGDPLVERDPHQSTTARIQTLDFANGIRLSDDQTLQCNLHVEIHGLRRLLRTLSETWGLCIPMEATLKSIYEAITQ